MAAQLISNAYQAVVGDQPTTTVEGYKERPDGSTMQALVYHGTQNVTMDQVHRPAITQPKDAIIRVTGTTVCGSDLHLYHSEIMQQQNGDILGHEFCGVVDEVGPECHLSIGQRVVASFQIACGECSYCKKGLSSMCDVTNNSSVMNGLYGHRFAGLFGYSHFAGGFAGGQAEYVRIPYADTNLLPLPDDVPDEKGLFLSDILSTSYHACWRAKIEEGDVVGVWGCGPIGLLCAFWSKLMGASRVICIDNIPDRLERAKRLGAETINFSERDTVEALQEMCPGGIDRAIDCAAFRYAKTLLHKVERAVGLETDQSEIVNECLKIVKKFGTIVLIADYAGYCNHFNIGALMEKGIRLVGGGQAPVQMHWKKILHEYIQTGKLDPAFDVVVSHRFQIEDIPKIYHYFDRKEKDIMKTFVQTKFSQPPAPGTPALSTLE